MLSFSNIILHFLQSYQMFNSPQKSVVSSQSLYLQQVPMGLLLGKEDRHGLSPVSAENSVYEVFQFKKLAASIDSKKESLFSRIEKIFFKDYHKDQITKIYELLKVWDVKQLNAETFQLATKEQYLQYYQGIEFLSARVYFTAISYIKKIKSKKINLEMTSENQKVLQFLSQSDLVFSYDRYFWAKQNKKNKFSEDVRQRKPIGSINHFKVGFKLIQESTIPLLYDLLSFMIRSQLILDPRHQQLKINNIFLKKMQNILQQNQKILFLLSMSIPSLQILASKKDPHNLTEQQLGVIQTCFPNYYFYSISRKKSINSLHKKFQDYYFLEGSHDYIQLMFPNHYQSSFNDEALPLNYIEAALFQDDQQVGLKMLMSIYIFFDFMGIRLDLKTLQLQLIDRERLEGVLLRHTHNHLRIMRILACTSVTGFRRIALNLLDFLRQYSTKSQLRNVFLKKWAVYGDQTNNRAKEMCFLEKEQFPKDHKILAKMHQNSQQQCNKEIEVPQINLKQEQNKDIQGEVNLHSHKNNQLSQEQLVQITNNLQKHSIEVELEENLFDQ